MNLRQHLARYVLLWVAGLQMLAPAGLAAGPSGTLLPPGDFSTKGNQIVDQTGRPVRLACIGWNQLDETRSLDYQTSLIAAHGFNCIRHAWANATKDMEIAVVDRMAASAAKVGLRIIVDNHTNEAGHGERDNWGAQQKNGLWYDLGGGSDGTDGGGNKGTVTDARFLADWQSVVRHFAGNHTIIGYDIRNEPADWPGMSVWGGGGDRDIAAMYKRVGDAIQAIDPDKLIIIEPPTSNFRGPRKYPPTLAVPNKLVYSPHEYPAEISGQKISSGPELVKRMNEQWGWVYNENVAPIFVGEMGSSMKTTQSKAWAATIVPYLNGIGPEALHVPAGGQPASTDWWDWGYLPGQNPEGTLEADWKTPRPEQLAVYSKLRQGTVPNQ